MSDDLVQMSFRHHEARRKGLLFTNSYIITPYQYSRKSGTCEKGKINSN